MCISRCTLNGQQYDTLRGKGKDKNGKKNIEMFVCHTSLSLKFSEGNSPKINWRQKQHIMAISVTKLCIEV